MEATKSSGTARSSTSSSSPWPSQRRRSSSNAKDGCGRPADESSSSTWNGSTSPAARKENATTRFRSRRQSTWFRSAGGCSSSRKTRNMARSSSSSDRSVRRPDCSRGSRRRKSTAGSGRKGRFGPRTARRIGIRVANGRLSVEAVAVAGLAAPVPFAGGGSRPPPCPRSPWSPRPPLHPPGEEEGAEEGQSQDEQPPRLGRCVPLVRDSEEEEDQNPKDDVPDDPPLREVEEPTHRHCPLHPGAKKPPVSVASVRLSQRYIARGRVGRDDCSCPPSTSTNASGTCSWRRIVRRTGRTTCRPETSIAAANTPSSWPSARFRR